MRFPFSQHRKKDFHAMAFKADARNGFAVRFGIYGVPGVHIPLTTFMMIIRFHNSEPARTTALSLHDCMRILSRSFKDTPKLS